MGVGGGGGGSERKGVGEGYKSRRRLEGKEERRVIMLYWVCGGGEGEGEGRVKGEREGEEVGKGGEIIMLYKLNDMSFEFNITV